MSRRSLPYLLAGMTGIISGVYIFRPVMEEAVTAQQTSEAMDHMKRAPASPGPPALAPSSLPPSDPHQAPPASQSK
ncbi:hypothetical protein BV22DRAFT_627696 [Leucogyrophana mollusca]|uniref:Uncharacterized protein n=1 Tax=Leucogyrophana mollusca TaxID=85980 RepID=A0ACB8BAP0_9AGAM|nr:hypothetical protein BV22DRAFT_627696 [Leucogyrophana mollusca]